ncbi:hypothetical protein PAECIP111893_03115 [Paenibacillus plantiphilus]|uniref:Methyl-accepting chemotaxis protein n=1 Tax=Paenibacillus plantiphilus TaxID=2905650 RepID=A0ABM9CCD5_9BACL|nr:methyl-accepting chemotaxis protein [Paenibacillus plantiphilus]CAH1210021.1 hypothetical protein PAECIP111893_03115 [Paenibacillus plantiphilus]
MKRGRFALSLRVKLVLLIGFPIVLYVFSTLYWMDRYDTDMAKLTHSLFETTNKVNTLVLNADRDFYQSLTALQLLESKLSDAAKAQQVMDEFVVNAEQAQARIDEAFGILQKEGLFDLKKKDGDLSIRMIADGFHANYSNWFNEAKSAAEDGQSKVFNPELMAIFEETREGINIIGEILDEHAANQIAITDSETAEIKSASGIGLMIFLLAIVAVGYVIIRNIARMIRYVNKLMSAVSEGDLREQPSIKHSGDEIGAIAHAVEAMISKVRGLIATISDNAAGVSTASAQMNTSAKQSAAAAAHVAEEIQEVNEGMEVQTRGAEETSRAIDEMAVGIGKIAENTSVISDAAMRTSDDTEHGQVQLEQLNKQMDGIKSVIMQLSDIITNLNERSNEIGLIAENITTFSNQTNILSLNASIEAARAGEHGRGFSVVADEIRKLAAQSLHSADVINQLVTVTQGEMVNASNVMTTTLGEVSAGSQLMTQVYASFTHIRNSIQGIAAQIHDNSAITEQMSASSEEVSATMEQSASTARTNMSNTQNVASATQEQLAVMDEIAYASDHLKDIVDELERSVATFKIR